MAFTIEEIENALTYNLENEPAYYQEIKDNANYTIIIDYLTGKSNTLQGVQPDYSIHYWASLLNLLKDIVDPSPNDQLVLDIIHHPDVVDYLGPHFNGWLCAYTLSFPDEKHFQAVIAQFKRMRLTDKDIFNYFAVAILYDDRNEKIELDGTALKNFLVHIIKNNKQLIFPTYGHHIWHGSWSKMYFHLIEEAKPDLAVNYALYSSMLRNNDAIEYFISYKNGNYLPAIIQNIKNTKDNDEQQLQSKLSAAIYLYEYDKDAYKDLVIELSHAYLEYFRLFLAKHKWESSCELKEFDGTDLDFLPCSVTAFHFLLMLERESAITMLQDWQQQKIYLDSKISDIIYRHLKQEALPFLQEAVKYDAAGIEYLRNAVKVLINGFDNNIWIPVLWDVAASKSRHMRELIARNLAEKDPDAETKAIALLEHKKTEARQTAAIVLSYFSSEKAQTAILKILNHEVNDNARDILLETVAGSLPKEADDDFINNMIEAARSRGKLKKPVESWLNEEDLPVLFYKNGQPLNADTTRFLLYRMSRVKGMRSDVEAKLIINQLDKEKSAVFALHIIKLFIDKQTRPEFKYLLALAALLGNDDVVDKIRITINKWIDESRVKMAEYGVGALALQGSNKALRWVEWYSRKYRNKKANVGAAATEALEAAAEELNITPYELGDRIVPDFGFDGLFKHFTINGEEYRAFIDSNFKIAFFNEDNKKLKSLPANADTELKEEFKAITKEVRDIVKAQSLRLEHYVVVQRKWTLDQWQQFFLNNPVMFIYATKLLWGIYDTGSALKQCFLCQEDTTLTDEEDNEITVPEETLVGIVHPLHLTSGLLQTWKQKFFDLSIDPVFPQLERPVYNLKEEDKKQCIVREFTDKRTEPGSIKNTLDKHGWRKGAAVDGGMIDSFFKDDYESHVQAVLEVEGVFAAGFDTDMDPKLGRLYFIDSTKEKGRWFNAPADEKDERLIPLGNLPEVFYSEVMAGVNAIKVIRNDAVQ
jgi:hypothetical protein